jgi:beta-lactamase regulating signal transducer with metallopeptidase domain
MNTLGTAFVALLNSLWQSALIALLVWAALRFLPRVNIRINAATRCAVWWAVLAAVVVLPLAPQHTNVRSQAPLPSYESRSNPVRVPVAPVPVAMAPVETPLASSRIAGPLTITAGAGLIVIFAIWSALSLFRMVQIVRSYRYLRGITERSRAVSPERMVNFNCWLLACSIDRTARLLVSSEIVSPMAVGFRRPAVIVPETLLNEFTAEELDHVLLHELAHIARYDDWTNLFAKLIAAILPIHPVAVWLIRNIEQEREAACDDWVVANTGEARPYAASLTRLFELCSARRRQLLATGMAGRASHLGERIEALLRSGRDFAPRVSLTRVALGAAILIGLVFAGAQAPRWIAFAQERPAPVEPVAPIPPIPLVAQVPAAPPAPQTPATPPIPRAPRGTLDITIPAEPPAEVAQHQQEQEMEFLQLQTKLRVERDQLREMQQRLTEENRRYTPDHPAVRELGNEIRAQEAQLQARKAQIAAAQSQLLAQQRLGQAQQDLRRNQQVNANRGGSFLAALVAAGYGNLSVDEIIELREHGVTPEFLRALGDAGLGKLAPKDLVALANNGVNPDLVRALRQAFPQITVREMVEAAQQGINQRDLREAKEFSPNLTLPQIIRLKQAGVI